MGVLDCGAMVIRGYFDVFDEAASRIEDIEKLLEEAILPVEFHPEREMLDGEHKVVAHFHDPGGEMRADLERAKEMISDACQIAQNVMGKIP